jgi:hypothetical protein
VLVGSVHVVAGAKVPESSVIRVTRFSDFRIPAARYLFCTTCPETLRRGSPDEHAEHVIVI